MFVDVSGWITRFHHEAMKNGDKNRQRIATLHWEAWETRETNPQHSLMLLQEGHDTAQTLHEHWWVVFYTHSIYNLIMYFILDYKTGLHLAVKNAVEVCKPEYQMCPLLSRVYRALIDAYLVMDPVGYEAKIREAIHFLETEVQIDSEVWHLLPSEHAHLAVALEQFDEALQAAQQYLERADSSEIRSDFHATYACSILCQIHYNQRNFEDLNRFAQQGEAYARRRGVKVILYIMQLWQAVCAQINSDSIQGKRLFLTATTNFNQLGATPIEDYFDALCAYHEACDELDHALTIREQGLTLAQKCGSAYFITEAILHRCRLLAMMGLLREEHLAAARDAAKELIDPSRFLAKLEKYQASPDAG